MFLSRQQPGWSVIDEFRLVVGDDLGHNPISDISDLINGQGIWATGAILPDQMSSLFVRHASIGLCVLVNYDHARSRKRFSYAHELAEAA